MCVEQHLDFSICESIHAFLEENLKKEAWISQCEIYIYIYIYIGEWGLRFLELTQYIISFFVIFRWFIETSVI